MLKLTKQQKKQLLNKAKSSGGTITAKEYRKILDNTKTKKELNLNFSFEFTKLNDNTYFLVMFGMHLSNNRINSLSFKNRLKYASAIKQSAEVCFILNKRIIPKKPYSSVSITPTAYNPRSRDDDGNSRTLKIVRDLLETYKIVINDSRKHFTEEKCKEVLQKEYKIELLIECA